MTHLDLTHLWVRLSWVTLCHVTGLIILAGLGSFPPAPANLSVKSVNFRHVLHWEPGHGTPPGTRYIIYQIIRWFPFLPSRWRLSLPATLIFSLRPIRLCSVDMTQLELQRFLSINCQTPKVHDRFSHLATKLFLQSLVCVEQILPISYRT